MSLSSTETDYRSYFMCAIMMEFYHLFLLTSGDGSPNMFPQQDLRVLVVSSRNLFQTVEKRKRPNAKKELNMVSDVFVICALSEKGLFDKSL